jgi:hypothetical protein
MIQPTIWDMVPLEEWGAILALNWFNNLVVIPYSDCKIVY